MSVAIAMTLATYLYIVGFSLQYQFSMFTFWVDELHTDEEDQDQEVSISRRSALLCAVLWPALPILATIYGILRLLFGWR